MHEEKKCLLTTNICTNVFDTEAVQASVTVTCRHFSQTIE